MRLSDMSRKDKIWTIIYTEICINKNYYKNIKIFLQNPDTAIVSYPVLHKSRFLDLTDYLFPLSHFCYVLGPPT